MLAEYLTVLTETVGDCRRLSETVADEVIHAHPLHGYAPYGIIMLTLEQLYAEGICDE